MTKKGTLAAYTPVGEFKMMEIWAEFGNGPDPCCPNTTFDSVSYFIKIQRRPTFYIINYVFPSILINAIGDNTLMDI
jgi:hypothetical protein